MSITEELKEWMKSVTWFGDDPDSAQGKLRAIADRIDAEHERACNEAWSRGFDWFDTEDGDPKIAEEHGWVRLPVDADGVPIHFGDLLHEHEDGYVFKVDGFKIWGWSKEWWVYQEEGIQAPAHKCTHYHELTVEDVLKEYEAIILDPDNANDGEYYRKMYAAKLRLAESEEE